MFCEKDLNVSFLKFIWHNIHEKIVIINLLTFTKFKNLFFINLVLKRFCQFTDPVVPDCVHKHPRSDSRVAPIYSLIALRSELHR
jgi:hypothetical protein